MALPSISLRPHMPSGMKRDDGEDDDHNDDDDEGNEVFVGYFNNDHKLHHLH